MKSRLLCLGLIALAMFLAIKQPALAEYSITRNVIASGGGEMSGGSYTLMATLGQAAAGDDGGFWSPLPGIEVWPEFWPDIPEIVFFCLMKAGTLRDTGKISVVRC